MRCTWVVAGLLAWGSVSLAQPGINDPPPPPPPPPPGGPPAPPPPPATTTMPPVPGQPQPPQQSSDVDEGVVRDANSERLYLAPTALTPPQGTWSFSDYQLFFAGIGYAVTDRFTLNATFLLPVIEDFPFIGWATAKAQIARAGNLRLAAHLQLFHVSGDGDSASAGTVGGVATLCIDKDCHSHLTGYLAAGFALESTEGVVPFVAAAGATFKVGKHVKFVFEADTAFILGEVDELANGFLGWYGVRFTSKNIGVDLGFAKPICDGCEIDELPMGFPFVSFTYRGYNDD